MSFDDACRLGRCDDFKGEIYQRQQEKWHRSGVYHTETHPPDATDSHTVHFEGLPKCTPIQLKHLLTEALRLLHADRQKIAKAYWGARGAQYSVKILSAALNFKIESKGETK